MSEVRHIDTSKLGPIRFPTVVAQNQARELFAAQLERRGSAWTNAANSVRAGFSNAWIDAGLGAIEGLLRQIPSE